MQQRRLGRTGLMVSNLVFGGGYVGGLLLHRNDAVKRTAVERALAAGVNWIDTAASYGDGASERALGWLLADLPQPPYLSTKFGVDPERLDDLPGQIERSLHASLTRLRRDSVDLLQLHNRIEPQAGGRALTPQEILGGGGVADTLDRLREQGLCRYTGITALGDAGCCRETIASGRFDTAQVYYNLLNPSAARPVDPAWTGHSFAGLLDACRSHDVGVLAIRILAAGVLATDERHGREIVITGDAEIPDEERRARRVFERLGERHGTRAQTAIRFVLANPDIAGAIVGLAELAHLDEALAAAEAGPLPTAALQSLDDLYQP